MLRQSERSQLLLLVAVLFVGTFLWRLSFHLKQQADWQPANQEALQHFKVVAFQDGRPSIVPLLQVPEGSTFYFEPTKEKEYIQKLQEHLQKQLQQLLQQHLCLNQKTVDPK